MLSDDQKKLVDLIAVGKLRNFEDWLVNIAMVKLGRTSQHDIWLQGSEGTLKPEFSDARIVVKEAGGMVTVPNCSL